MAGILWPLTLKRSLPTGKLSRFLDNVPAFSTSVPSLWNSHLEGAGFLDGASNLIFFSMFQLSFRIRDFLNLIFQPPPDLLIFPLQLFSIQPFTHNDYINFLVENDEEEQNNKDACLARVNAPVL